MGHDYGTARSITTERYETHHTQAPVSVSSCSTSLNCSRTNVGIGNEELRGLWSLSSFNYRSQAKEMTRNPRCKVEL